MEFELGYDYPHDVPKILLATDADWIHNDIDAALASGDTTVLRVRKGSDVVEAIKQTNPEVVMLDMQIGNMGGIATCYEIRNEEGAGRINPVRVIILADRPDDRWLIRGSGPDGWLIKPLDRFRLRRAVQTVLAGAIFDEHLHPVS